MTSARDPPAPSDPWNRYISPRINTSVKPTYVAKEGEASLNAGAVARAQPSRQHALVFASIKQRLPHVERVVRVDKQLKANLLK